MRHMGTPKDGPIPRVEVDDPAAAFRKLEAFTRQILSIPKKGVDSGAGKDKSVKRRQRGR